MPFTSNKGLSVPATGTLAGTWGSDSTTPTSQSSNALNEGVISLLDQALGGITSLSLSSANVALTQLQAQNAMIRMTGTLTANVLVSPNIGIGVLMVGFYYFENLTSGSFTVTMTNSVGTALLPQGRRGVVFIDNTYGPRVVALAGVTGGSDPVPAGSVMLFYQNAAPTGWVISAALNDYALKIVSSAGGVVSGSVAYSTLYARTATDGHTLTVVETPSHQHFEFSPNSSPESSPSASNYPLSAAGGGSAGQYSIAGNTNAAPTVGLSSPTGGGSAHTHDIDMRVLTASVILATKS